MGADDPWPPNPWRWLPAPEHWPRLDEEIKRAAAYRCRRHGLTYHDARDVAQDVHAELMGTPPDSPDVATYAACRDCYWRRANNAARRLKRSYFRHSEFSDYYELAAKPLSDGWHERYLELLPAGQLRDLVYAHFVERYTHIELMERFGLTRGQVASALNQARVIFRRRLS